MNLFINRRKKLKKRQAIGIYLLLPMLLLSVGLNAQTIDIKGKVIDPDGNALIGTAVIVKGTSIGATTNDDGDYILSNVPKGSTLEFRLVGFVTQEIKVTGEKTSINVVLLEESESLEEVTVVAFGTQKKESVIASVSTVSTKELKVPSSNLTTAFAGRIAGLISYQRTGEPGVDNAQFFIRGVTTFGTGKANPLILIDGVEMTTDDLARLTTDDIASFSIMKDANATALYGARGANGVILVGTKEGREGKAKVQFRAEGSFSSPTEILQYADPVTYMRLHNEAVLTRDPMVSMPYSTSKIYNTERGSDPVYYPAVNWQEMLFNNNTFNQRYNMNISGGGSVARYYIAASYSKDNGIIKVDKRNSFNNNIDINRYVLRSNINVNITKTTEAIVRLHGAFDDYSGPLDGGADLYNKALNANPVYFLPHYPADEAHRYIKYILFGNYNTGGYLNPYAETVKGYKSGDRSNMLAQFELKQNLDFITKGLSARGLFNVSRYSYLEMRNEYVPFFFSLSPKSGYNDEYRLNPLNPTTGRDYLSATAGARDITSSMYFEGALLYNREFSKKHTISGLLVYTIRESLNGNATDLQSSLPHRNLGLAGRLTYNYDSRYFVEGNFGYNGSERFSDNERFGFFPSIGAGWIVTNEEFMKPWSKTISKLKLKATYGLVGNDEIGNTDERFFYLANVNMNDANRSYRFGTNFDYGGDGDGTGMSISRYSDPNITWEISRKTNLGIELNIRNELEIQLDYFVENRSKILQQRSFIPTLMGLQGNPPSSNIGKAGGRGIDLSVDYTKSFNKDLWAVLRGNFTYASSKYEVYEEPDYVDTPWRRHYGRKISQQWGYVAERLFVDENEVQNSPPQFGEYGAGDIKYKDINGDFRIDENDQVPIGFPTTPEIIYGFGISAGYKNLDISCFFQGSARSSFWIDANATAPFVNGAVSGFTTNRAMLQYWVDSHWSEDDRDIYALWPRLSEYNIENNQKQSTWFMRDGSFLRLKTAEVGYTLPKGWVERVKLQSARFYVSGSNLLVFSKFKMWDPEMAGNGLAYPLQRVFNIGLNVEF
ncbi:MAG: TonB-dependent receptor [Prevotellaceae bacterium]|jgi:TonB-linked SusC/RagA family outer membrane protein|nr:TonB-dependent receptor [Prevotellaceae bacterium]